MVGAVIVACAACPGTATPQSDAGGGSEVNAPVPGTACRIFPSRNIWNTDISTAPVHPKSASWLAAMEAETTLLHPDFGGPPYGFPFAVVDEGHARVPIRFLYADESDRGPYPFGPEIPLEEGSDRHALIVDADACVLYELFDADWHGGWPTAGSGAIFTMRSNALRPDGWTSADAAGLSILAGLVRYDEVHAGVIRHAIRMTAEQTDASHLWPARHDAGEPSGQSLPPMGARFRLEADFDISGFSAEAQVILTAMQHYGLFVADNGSNFFFSGTMDDRWTDDLLDELKSVPASEFEAIDESGLMLDPDSGKARQP